MAGCSAPARTVPTIGMDTAPPWPAIMIPLALPGVQMFDHPKGAAYPEVPADLPQGGRIAVTVQVIGDEVQDFFLPRRDLFHGDPRLSESLLTSVNAVLLRFRGLHLTTQFNSGINKCQLPEKSGSAQCSYVLEFGRNVGQQHLS